MRFLAQILNRPAPAPHHHRVNRPAHRVPSASAPWR